MSRHLGTDKREINYRRDQRKQEIWIIPKKERKEGLTQTAAGEANGEETNIMISYQVLAGNWFKM